MCYQKCISGATDDSRHTCSGPGHEKFTGVWDNNELRRKCVEALCATCTRNVYAKTRAQEPAKFDKATTPALKSTQWQEVFFKSTKRHKKLVTSDKLHDKSTWQLSTRKKFHRQSCFRVNVRFTLNLLWQLYSQWKLPSICFVFGGFLVMKMKDGRRLASLAGISFIGKWGGPLLQH